MGNSLRDQLLKAGLVNKKQVNKAKQAKRINRKQKKGKEIPDENSETREKKKAQAERNRELNRRRNEEKKRLEELAQVRQLIETNRLTLEDREDDEPYHFAVGKRIKKLFFPEKIIKQLSQGHLAIVSLDNKYVVIPAKAALQIAERDRKSLLVFHGELNR